MNKYDWKYILKRVLTFFIIFVILSFFKILNASAKTIPIINSGSSATFYPSGTSSLSFNNWYSTNSGTSLSQITFELESGMDQNLQGTLYAGQFLFDFYVETNDLTTHLASCNGSNSDFSFIDLTSGNRISSATASKSQCLDSYYTIIGGNRAIHYLYSWTITDTASYPYMTNEYRLIVRNWTGTGYTTNNATYLVIVGNLQEYDPIIVQNFTSVAEQQRLNQQAILNATQNAQNIMNNQDQNTQDILNSQTQINQNINNIGIDTGTIIQNQNANAQQAHQDSQAINDSINNDNVNGAESQVDSLLQNNAFNDTTGIQSIVQAPLNFIQGLSSTCQPLSMTIPYINTNVTIPCMKQELTNRVPSLVPILSTAINGFIIYRILLDIFHIIKSAREPDEDRIEVLDL